VLDAAVAACRTLLASNFADLDRVFPSPAARPAPVHAALELPPILVPPDAPGAADGWPAHHLRIFGDGSTPAPCAPGGYAARAGLRALVDVYEVNRKEAARLLLEYARWAPAGTFGDGGASLEATVVEVVLGMALALPEPAAGHRALYYAALVAELCKLAPAAVGPAVGRAIRALYAALGAGLDADVARRFAEWFAVHMSNFGFQWVWKEWCVPPPRPHTEG
jgi:nuclear cap-binding protein subunit 1